MERGQFYNLEQFLGGYLHQDWDLDYPDANSAIADFVKQASPKCLRATEQELVAFIAVAESSENQSKLLMKMNCFYDPTPDGISVVEWLREVGSKLRKET